MNSANCIVTFARDRLGNGLTNFQEKLTLAIGAEVGTMLDSGTDMTTTVAVVNLKGGVGKTAIAVNLAAYAGNQGLRTLLVDVDPQTNATFSCIDVQRWRAHAEKHGTIANLLGARPQTRAEQRPVDASDVVIRDVFQNVDLLPSHLDLFTIDLDLAGAVGRELRLKRALDAVSSDYKLIVCDCPPNLTIPTQNALAASTHYVVPISPDYLSSIGVAILVRRVKGFCDDLVHKLDHAGIIMSRVGRPARHREETTAAIREEFGAVVLSHELKERVAVSESASRQQSIFSSGDTAAIAEWKSMSAELLTRLKVA